MPASVAAGWPKRRDMRTSLTRGSRACSSRIALLGAVGRGVDGEHQLPLLAQAVEHRRQALVDAPDVVLLVVGRG